MVLKSLRFSERWIFVFINFHILQFFFKKYKKYCNFVFQNHTDFSAPVQIHLVPRFFSAAKKHFLEEIKNGHAINVQNQNLMRSLKWEI
jgi:hypothetical protein